MKTVVQKATLKQVLSMVKKPDMVSLIASQSYYTENALRLFKMGPLTIPVIDSANHFDWIMDNQVFKNFERLGIQVKFEAAMVDWVPSYFRKKLRQTSGLQFTHGDSPHRDAMLHDAGSKLGKGGLSEHIKSKIDELIMLHVNSIGKAQWSTRAFAETLTDVIVSEMFDGIFSPLLMRKLREFFLVMREYLIFSVSPAAIFGKGRKAKPFEKLRNEVMSEVHDKLMRNDYDENFLLPWLEEQVNQLGFTFGTDEFNYAMTVKVMSLLQALLDTTTTLISSTVIALTMGSVYPKVKANLEKNALGAVYLALHMVSPLIVDPRVATEGCVLALMDDGEIFSVKKGQMIYFNLLHIGRDRIQQVNGEERLFDLFISITQRAQQLRKCHFASAFMGIDNFSCKGSGLAVALAEYFAQSLVKNTTSLRRMSDIKDIDLGGTMIMDAIVR